MKIRRTAMEREFIDLFEFQKKLKQGVELLFPSRVWLKAEISAVKARSGGHCYLELSQSDSKGLVAKASAIIWSSKYRFIAPYFESVTGSPLTEGMTVLMEVQVNYSELYGFSLIVIGPCPVSLEDQIKLLRCKCQSDKDRRWHLHEIGIESGLLTRDEFRALFAWALELDNVLVTPTLLNR